MHTGVNIVLLVIHTYIHKQNTQSRKHMHIMPPTYLGTYTVCDGKRTNCDFRSHGPPRSPDAPASKHRSVAFFRVFLRVRGLKVLGVRMPRATGPVAFRGLGDFMCFVVVGFGY